MLNWMHRVIGLPNGYKQHFCCSPSRCGTLSTKINFIQKERLLKSSFTNIALKTFGRTPLTAVSPKKTWEGAIVGLGGCIATSVILSRIFCWPKSLIRCLILCCAVFVHVEEECLMRWHAFDYPASLDYQQ